MDTRICDRADCPPVIHHATSAIDDHVARIEAAYVRLDHELGWRYLNAPARTLAAETELAFLGLNPGGSRYEPPHRSVEAGLAYRVERWGPRNTLNPLQLQVRLLFDGLAAALNTETPELMDGTLAWNYCPFRSPSWDTLPRRQDSIAFSRELATDILEVARPRVIMCLGDVPSREIRWVLEHHAHELQDDMSRPAGWGTVTYGLARYRRDGRATLVVRLPHLSRFAIFGRPASRGAVDELTAAICAELSASAS